jgi:hypothetical protein
VTSAVSRGWRLACLLILAVGLAGCGISSEEGPSAGRSASINLSLNTVPTIRSVTVSPGKATFGSCSGGLAARNTKSTSTRLGFPYGKCWVGRWTGPLNGDGLFPVTVTNTGIAAYIDVNGASAVPSDDGSEWSLCNRGSNPAVTCGGRGHNWPGTDQYLVQNFGPNRENPNGLTDTPTCDREFGLDGRCWALEGASQNEGMELTGPYQSTDSSTSWTVTITWTPVP